MNPLLLYGYGTTASVKDRCLVVKEGRFTPLSFNTDEHGEIRESKAFRFRPRRIPFDSIVVLGNSGYVSFEAIRFCSVHDLPIFLMGYDGSLTSSILPPQPIRADVRRAQLEAYLNDEKRVEIAREFVSAKLERSAQILNWLREKFDVEKEFRCFSKERLGLVRAKTVNEVRTVEGRSADFYWRAFAEVVPRKLEFKSRRSGSRYNASDPTNALLNYGYAFLQSCVRRAINATGLDAGVGFLHEDKAATTPLVYDFQEPFRWLIDYTVLGMVESRAFGWDDFYFTGDDYRMRFKPPLLDRYLAVLREHFNSVGHTVMYRGDCVKWDTLIGLKVQEFARYLVGKSDGFDLKSPAPVLDRSDTRDLRERILSLSASEARKLGLGKSTVHYLRKHARSHKSFRIYKPVLEKLDKNKHEDSRVAKERAKRL